MPIGRVQFWVRSRSQGAVLDERGARLLFTAKDLEGLRVEEIRDGLEVAFDLGPDGTARRVRQPRSSFLRPPEPLDRDDPLLTAVPLPPSLRELVERFKGLVHPGLRLDKYMMPAVNQEGQKRVLSEVAERSQGDTQLLAEVLRRRDAMLDAAEVVRWDRETAGPLTLHLARASALENAGLCLHPIYGFTFLPGSGLKGLARAYAETVWRPGQPDDAAAATDIERIFGFIRGTGDEGAAAGTVIFHDAWPASWPRLMVDIVNNHHFGYYRGEDWPGDWESPSMVYFLAVPPGQTFSFALGKRRGDVDVRLLGLARAWLDGGLTHLGCGAKTAAGYGHFAPQANEPPMPSGPNRTGFSAAMTLESPAFLAGARQEADDCDLRPATLRGLLRWWWRTLHAGALSQTQLRDLEAAIWGNTAAGSVVQLQVESQRPGSLLYDKSARIDMRSGEKGGPYGIPGADPRKTTQGLWYASFGMHDGGRRRFVVEPGAAWTIRLTARTNKALREHGLGPDDVLDQARAALWLLCRYGGVGSKARKGFGSLSAGGLDEMDLDHCREASRRFRRGMGLPEDERPGVAESPALCDLVAEEIEAEFPWDDVWPVLDQVGFAWQGFAKRFAHDHDQEGQLVPTWSGRDAPTGYTKASLGVPRRMDGGDRRWAGERHASPVHIHVERAGGGAHRVRVIAFAAPRLPTRESSVTFLRAFLDHLRDDLRRRSRLPPRSSRPGPSGRGGRPGPVGGGGFGQRRDAGAARTRGELHGGPAPAAPPRGHPKAGDRVEATLLPERTKKGGWKARHEPTGLSGPIVDSAKVPSDKEPGNVMTLIVHAVGAREMTFRVE
ncbi:type III-B CRISPR module RAMP protein Cmr6 [Tautonia plasticadhaerens]|uniref:RAMP superfamily protein n=1 Tax=Tautonia plasticadhaerens TaxID=2527974 RepID=A0A518GYT0_9BACT|nr:type III-B CRISPR module RAMP protein Cmr6 [Tautonia plasticadhaerens]QDV33703.1 RAMP superfamily protein [Tautonia plasticadhaerens]